jgi:hypothetical protein
MAMSETAAGYSRKPPSIADELPMLDDLDPCDGGIHTAAIERSLHALDAHMAAQEVLKARIAQVLCGDLPNEARDLLLDIQVHFGAQP